MILMKHSMFKNSQLSSLFKVILLLTCITNARLGDAKIAEPMKIFIFAGQSNMVGSDSRVQDIKNFPPFKGLEEPQTEAKFYYVIGRENKTESNGWIPLQPVNNVVGPELSFVHELRKHIEGPIGIIKIAAGGTHLGGDWNPDHPAGFKLYPLAIKTVMSALADLESQGILYSLEGFMWHQGENDMFNEAYMNNYRANLKNFIHRWRSDLNLKNLPFYIGELNTKTIWGMDLRPRMYTISLAQKQVTSEDRLATYIPTSHVGVEIGGGVGLHYHYGTLGQLQHGVNYANAYLKSINKTTRKTRKLEHWPYKEKSKVKLFVFAGHRNMEGERAFVQDLEGLGKSSLAKANHQIAYRFSLGGGYYTSDNWEPFGITGFYSNFGPELSFVSKLTTVSDENIAIAKFTHSGSQIIDWTPSGSEAATRNLYFPFIEFINQSVQDLESKGLEVSLEGIFYHIGENDMSWNPFRKGAADRVKELVQGSRRHLKVENVKWFISQQPPTDHKNVNKVDVVTLMTDALSSLSQVIHIKAFDLPPQPKKLVLNSEAIISLGEILADAYLENKE